MADKTKERYASQNLDSLTDFGDHELQGTMEEFLEEEKKANTNIWNVATIAGIAMFFVGMMFLIQSLGGMFSIGPDLSGIIEILPLFGGILVTFIGFGFLVGDRKKVKAERKRRKKKRYRDFDFESDFGDEQIGNEDFGLENDLDYKSGDKRRSSGMFNRDFHVFRRSKKLYKSRTDKKWAGVCGGLAKYFGISPTVIRLLFVITFFAGSGTSLLVYIALAIALDKEPPEMMDDFDF